MPPEPPADPATSADPADALARAAAALEALAAASTGVVPELLNAAAAARFCGLSRSKFYDLDATGFVPQPVEIGPDGAKRWSRSELLQWIRAGCPSRVRWAAMRSAALRQVG